MFWKLLFVFSSIVIHVSSKYASPCNTTDQQPGLCMPVKSCKPVFNFFTQISKSGEALTEPDKNRIASMFCGTFQNVPHVCCPKTEIQLNADGVDILQRHTCGIYFVDRIARGSVAPLFQYPWMALLKYEDEFKPFKCGGTLISDQYVLTAAHCVKANKHLIKAVRLGEHQISTEVDCTNSTRKNQCAPPVEDIDIEEIILHEDYQNAYNDIALIKLNRKVEFKRHIKPVCLPISDDLRTKVHENYIISGWGRTEDGSSSDILLTAFVPTVDRTDCENQLRNYNLRHSLNLGHICAGGKNLVDSCPGDSGGPLGYRDFYNGSTRFVQFGIVSMGLYRCGIVNAPGIYTNVSYHMQWITDNLKETTYEKHNISPRYTKG